MIPRQKVHFSTGNTFAAELRLAVQTGKDYLQFGGRLYSITTGAEPTFMQVEPQLELTWHDVFDAEKPNSQTYTNLGVAANAASWIGYEYVCWSDRVYNVKLGGADTGLRRKDIK